MKHDKRPEAPPMFEKGFHAVGVARVADGLAVITIEVDIHGRGVVTKIGRPMNAIGASSYISQEAKLALFRALPGPS